MKKFEEAELKVMLVENSIICTSGGCSHTHNIGCMGVYSSSTDNCSIGYEGF